MKYLKKINLTKESESITLDELKDVMKHPFLNRDFIRTIFTDLVDDCGYMLGFQGEYNHIWVTLDGYETINDKEEDIHKRYKLKGFSLFFYKDLNVESGEFRPISEIQNELSSIENSIKQYLNQSEFDDEYEFKGMKILIDGDPKARNLQKIWLKFTNANI